jgi:hypothetical protein
MVSGIGTGIRRNLFSEEPYSVLESEPQRIHDRTAGPGSCVLRPEHGAISHSAVKAGSDGGAMTPTTFAFEQYSESEAERFLRRFKMGPVARSDLIAMNNRFSAIVKTLRLQGHEITRETGDGEDIYMWRGCTPKVKVTPEMQEFY